MLAAWEWGVEWPVPISYLYHTYVIAYVSITSLPQQVDMEMQIATLQLHDISDGRRWNQSELQFQI